MDMLLGFFSDLIVFTAGLVVAALWLLVLTIVFEEIVSLAADYIRKAKKEDSDEEALR